MNILIVGGGGREHALVRSLSAAGRRIFAAPGNAGMTGEAELLNIDPMDIDRLVRFAGDSGVDLAIIGPEAPLVAGAVDAFSAAGIRAFGPRKDAARLEGSKIFAKQFMVRHGIPTAPFAACDSPEQAMQAARKLGGGAGAVIKADGLAAGKGVFVASDIAEADAAIERLMVRGELGDAGLRVVVEQRLSGGEISVMAVCGGTAFVLLPSARDHKRLETGERGPNTGGMGVISPAPGWDESLRNEIVEAIMKPTLAGLEAEGMPYTGVLYAGLMLDDGRPYVLEYNCRFGDPETQAVLGRLQPDAARLLIDACDGRLPPGGRDAAVGDGATVCVVLASKGYPGRYQVGYPITGLSTAAAIDGVSVFHSGTALVDGRFVTAGGRVLSVTARGPNLEEAADSAYAAADRIEFEGKIFRTDIGREGSFQ